MHTRMFTLLCDEALTHVAAPTTILPRLIIASGSSPDRAHAREQLEMSLNAFRVAPTVMTRQSLREIAGWLVTGASKPTKLAWTPRSQPSASRQRSFPD